MAGRQYREKVRSKKHNHLSLFKVVYKLAATDKQITYRVISHNEPIANSEAMKKAEKDGFKSHELELVEIQKEDIDGFT